MSIKIDKWVYCEIELGNIALTSLVYSKKVQCPSVWRTNTKLGSQLYLQSTLCRTTVEVIYEKFHLNNKRADLDLYISQALKNKVIWTELQADKNNLV